MSSGASRCLKHIHILGANGFPICMYGPLMDQIASNISRNQHWTDPHLVRGLIRGTDVFGHTKDSPDWRNLVSHVCSSIEMQHSAPVIGIGHSLGGALMGAAAGQRPDLFKKLIIIDSPFFSIPKRVLWSLLLYLPERTVRQHHPLIRSALKKPDTWRSMEEAEAFFRSKKLYQQFDKKVMAAFLKDGLVEGEDGKVKLLFSNSDECDIYYKAPSELKYHFRQYLKMHDFPHEADFFYSNQSHILTGLDVLWLKRFGGSNLKLRGVNFGHFWPLEDPGQCADMLCDYL